MWIFGKKETPEQMVRRYQRALDRSMRELDRERAKLENQEKKLMADIRRFAKQGQTKTCQIMAKDIVRTRRYVQKFIQMRTHLQAVSLKMQTMRSTQAMAQAMGGVTKAMRSLNNNLKMPAIQKIMQDFERESEMMSHKEEMMGDAIDDVLDEDGDEEEESNQILSQVLEEAGISISEQLGATPVGTTPQPGQKEDDLDRQLQQRLNGLRGE
ncbi:hypothetical protein H696_05601 [Fonticula alba]|uniref:Charged multivesicular body protein 2A n=1 Tax=Fonticula alba TaxID=691883 RepID=A0A058Z156_FONAL|nr:hypothetical protein H696_05601 [Fonticula alba]KCV67871.1 hypothetical protein H696_05601 [Fonticula alba]|eukprot:XP_009497691.1 hypothetical protein H696_05601 [Fonticula alba]